MQTIMMVYHEPADRNALETTLHTLRLHNKDCRVEILTDNCPRDIMAEFTRRYGVDWYDCDDMKGKRAATKVDWFCETIRAMPDGWQVIVADVDLYFLGDPFEAFVEYPDMEVGITSRGYDFWCPINGGMFFFRASDWVAKFLEYHQRIIHLPMVQQMAEFPAYAKWRQRWNHVRWGLDWTVGQDFFAVLWNNKTAGLTTGFTTMLTDVTNKYNFCPATEKWGRKWCKNRLVQAMNDDKDKVVLHLKSSLKEMLYDGTLPEAITRHERGRLKWK